MIDTIHNVDTYQRQRVQELLPWWPQPELLIDAFTYHFGMVSALDARRLPVFFLVRIGTHYLHSFPLQMYICCETTIDKVDEPIQMPSRCNYFAFSFYSKLYYTKQKLVNWSIIVEKCY